jgi:hypothetical protein
VKDENAHTTKDFGGKSTIADKVKYQRMNKGTGRRNGDKTDERRKAGDSRHVRATSWSGGDMLLAVVPATMGTRIPKLAAREPSLPVDFGRKN